MALVRRFCKDRHGSTRILSGACDALFTPPPLGPLLDIAEATGGRVSTSTGGSAYVGEVVLHGDQPRHPRKRLLDPR